jgi:hypothetical protein
MSKKVKCIEHIWKSGTSDISLVFKYGRFAMFYEVCEVCGKKRIARW